MKLYNWKGAPNPQRVIIFIKEKCLDVEIINVGHPTGASLSPDYLANNPHRLVPILELEDGTKIGEAMAICRYLETIYPAKTQLMGINPLDQAIVDMWERRADMEGLGAVGEVFRNSHPAFVNRGLPGQTENIPQISDLVVRGSKRLNLFFTKFDNQIGKNPYITGERFTVADITTFCATNFALKVCKLKIPQSCENFRRWHKSISSRPSIKN